VYVAVGNVEGLNPGIYKYVPSAHSIQRVLDGDVRGELAQASLGQRWVEKAAADIVIAAAYERTTAKYGERGVRYVHMEAGHAAQNLCLQATALRLGVVTVGAFDDERVSATLNLPQNQTPLYVIPVGRIEKP
jgi:SagB-type dehydrogenase family enzyme